MSRLGRGGATVVTMVSVASLVLLATGWGSAVAANVTSVFVTNRASNPVPVKQHGTANVYVTNTKPLNAYLTNTPKVAQSGAWNVGINGTPTVKSGDTASVLAQGGDVPVSAGQRLVLNPNAQDVSAYREVTVYLEFVGGEFNTNTELTALTDDGTPYLFAFDDLVPQDLRVVKTYDPAPAKLVLQLWNQSGSSETDIDYTIVGRTN
jgi:hypothetical protein